MATPLSSPNDRTPTRHSAADNRELDALLTKLGVAHTFHEFPGSHDWGYWREHVKTALEAVTARMR